MCHGLPRGRRLRAKVGAKGLLGDGPGNVIAFLRYPNDPANPQHPESTAVTRKPIFRSNSAATGPSCLAWQWVCTITGLWSGAKSGSLGMLIPSMEQEGFEVGGVGGKSLGG